MSCDILMVTSSLDIRPSVHGFISRIVLDSLAERGGIQWPKYWKLLRAKRLHWDPNVQDAFLSVNNSKMCQFKSSMRQSPIATVNSHYLSNLKGSGTKSEISSFNKYLKKIE